MEIAGWSQFDDLGAGSFKFMAESIVLGMRLFKVGRVVEAKAAPAGGIVRPVPAGGARRTHHDALERADHLRDLCGPPLASPPLIDK